MYKRKRKRKCKHKHFNFTYPTEFTEIAFYARIFINGYQNTNIQPKEIRQQTRSNVATSNTLKFYIMVRRENLGIISEQRFKMLPQGANQ
jgi:hypothetical protein